MRAMKHARTLAHDQLVRDVLARLLGHFEPSVTAIKVHLYMSLLYSTV